MIEKTCKDCKKNFIAAAEDLLLCNRCRRKRLADEQPMYRVIHEEARAVVPAFCWRPPTDYRIVDEVGREVWASELQKRYHTELLERAGKALRVGSAKKMFRWMK